MSKSNPFFGWHRPSVIESYGIAVLSVTAALIIMLLPLLHLQAAPASLFLCAVILSSWFGGPGPGLFATVLSVLAFYYFLLTTGNSLDVTTGEMPRLIIFTMSALFVGSLSAAQRSASESLSHARADLDRTIQELMKMNEALHSEIADRERAEGSLRESEDRFRRLVELMPVAVYVCDASGIIQSYNKRAVELWGREPKLGDSAERFCGSFHLYYPDGKSMPHHKSPMAETLRTGSQARDLEAVIQRPDGSRITVAVNIDPLRNRDGELVGAINCFQDITERKRAEEALRHSEDRLRLVIDTVPALILTGRPDGYLDFFNQRWLNYVGLSSEDLMGWKWTAVIHPEDVRAIVEKWRNAIATGQPFEVESRLRRADGEYRWMVHCKVPLRDDRGNIVKWYGSSIDIEDRKRAEDDLRMQKEILQKIFDNVPVMIRLIGPDGKTKLVNREWERTMGWTLEEILGQDLDVFAELYPDPKYRQEVMKFVFGLKTEFADFKTRVRDGRVIDTSWASTHLSDGTVIGIGRDITERKLAEDALRRSEAYLAAAQSLSHTGSWALNVSSGELFWSQETYRIFGFDPAKTSASVYEAFLPRIHPEDRPKVEEGLKRAAAQKGSYEVDYRIVLPDGSIKHIHDVVYPLISETGEVVERYGVIMDVTERKQAEERLQRSRDQLRALAARLRTVREEERARLAREIHDELGQALTAIKIDLSSLIYELPADKKQKSESVLKLADETIQSVRRIATELRPGILDDMGLVAAIEWAAEEFEARTGTPCRLDLPEDDMEVDPEHATALFRIFQETLTNVTRHANATEVSVRLAREDGTLTLEIHDNGKGVSEEQFSAGNSLGILGMRERALLLGGELIISGAPGEGTTVRVWIPEVQYKGPVKLK